MFDKGQTCQILVTAKVTAPTSAGVLTAASRSQAKPCFSVARVAPGGAARIKVPGGAEPYLVTYGFYLAGQCQPYGEGKSKAYKGGSSDNVSAHHGKLGSYDGCETYLEAPAKVDRPGLPSQARGETPDSGLSREQIFIT